MHALRDVAQHGKLAAWTRALTAVSVATCHAVGWQASAKDYQLERMPVPHFEYLTIDVMAFPGSDAGWRFPIAAIELENSTDSERIAYSLWKVLCVRSSLRVVFCYRRDADAGAPLVREVCDKIIPALQPEARMGLDGETVIVVGSRNDAATFPYGFFKWWYLEPNIGSFRRWD